MKFSLTRICNTVLASLLLLAPALAPPAAAQVAAGPAAWSGNQTWAADSVNGGSLTGYFYWPSSQPAVAGKRALVLVLHGCQQTAAGDVIASGSDQGFNWGAMANQYGAVILAPNATGNVYANHCWDYASTNHNRTSGHDAILLDLVNRFVGNAQYAIDPKQVYVTGLSSGGGEAMALACLAPDIFAGVGINAGPPPGTTTAQISYVPAGFSAANAASRCTAMAGGSSASFASQIASVIWGSSDYTVSQSYGPMDAAAMRSVYGGSFTPSAADAITGGGSNVVYLDSAGKKRTSEITVSGMAHAWPAGSGGQNSNYVDATKVNYPAFLMSFWNANNLRTSSAAAPAMTACSASVSGNTITVSGAASVSGGSIASYHVQLAGAATLDDAAAGSGASFSKSYAAPANGYYTGSVSATAAGTGQSSANCAIAQFLVGPAPALPAPTGLAATAASASSITLAWNAVGGATGYNVYRNGAKLNPAALSATGYVDSGLAAATSYSYRVSALGGGGESAQSAALSASTGSAWTCSSTSASNYAHVQAGRAHASGGYALANGSNQSMGLYNLFYTSVLAQTASGYYVIGACP